MLAKDPDFRIWIHDETVYFEWSCRLVNVGTVRATDVKIKVTDSMRWKTYNYSSIEIGESIFLSETKAARRIWDYEPWGYRRRKEDVTRSIIIECKEYYRRRAYIELRIGGEF